MSTHGAVRIGISGWTYKPWRGVFYPKKLPQKQELSFAAQTYPSVEINGTFYSLQRPSSYQKWAAATPPNFVFAIKGSRYITHMRRLRNIRIPMANFFASGILALEDKLGPFLWQFPPNFAFQPDLLDEFFTLLPRTTEAAAILASEHDLRLKGRAFLEPQSRRPLRHAIEIRHPSFVAPDFIRLLRRHRIALVCADTVEWPLLLDVTADFLYLRLHGSEVLYASGYDPPALNTWAARIAAWAQGREPRDSLASSSTGKMPRAEYASNVAPPKRAKRDVYVYFDNDMKVRAPLDALSLTARVSRLLAE
ncbi:MAG: DUF72 domain-containing protein [Acidobacteriaceae bacterium]